jgi:hypothetical protein
MIRRRRSAATDTIPDLRVVRGLRVESAVGRGRSRPVIVLADDGGRYVVKFRSSDKTARRSIAEVIAGACGDVLGVPQPERVLMAIDDSLDTSALPPEKIEEAQASYGLVFGTEYLDGAVSLRRRPDLAIDPEFAARVVWFDSLVANGDRKHRNPNVLVHHDTPWVIDNDSAFVVHHSWAKPASYHRYLICPSSALSWWRLREHALLPWASSISGVGEWLAPRLTLERVAGLAASVPESWFEQAFPGGFLTDPRQVYLDFIAHRLTLRQEFEQNADDLRLNGICLER